MAIRRGKLIESLVICEDIRVEKDTNKLMFIGVYPDNQIKFLDPELEASMEATIQIPLALWVQIRKKDQSDQGYLKITGPTGTIVGDGSLVLSGNGATAWMVLASHQFLIHAFGSYTITVESGGIRDSRTFEVFKENKPKKGATKRKVMKSTPKKSRSKIAKSA